MNYHSLKQQWQQYQLSQKIHLILQADKFSTNYNFIQ